MSHSDVILRPAWRVLFLSRRLFISLILLIATFTPWVETKLQMTPDPSSPAAMQGVPLFDQADRISEVIAGIDYLYWLRLLALAGVVISLLGAFFYRLQWRFVIGRRGLESRRGVIGRDEKTVDYANVRYVQVTQSFLQRLFGVGNVMVGASATDEPEVVFYDIGSPLAWRDRIQARLSRET